MGDSIQCPILAGVRALEIGGDIRVAFCGRLLAAMGADVVKVEPPQGDELRRRGPFAPADDAREHGGLFLYLNGDKRSVALDMASTDGRQRLGRLIEGMDVALVGLAPLEQEHLGLGAEALRADREGLIVTSLTPFGVYGPYKDYRGYDLTALHWGGIAHATPRSNADPEQEPLRPDGYLSEFLAGLHGALATTAAVLRRDRLGAVGAAIDISAFDAVAYTQFIKMTGRDYDKQAAAGPRARRATMAPLHFVRCRDGHVLIMTPEAHQWEALVDFMGRPQWATAEYLQDRTARADAWETIEPLIAAWAQSYTAEELYQQGSVAGVPCAPAATVAQFVSAPHMVARGFFTTVVEPGLGEVGVPGPAVRMTATPWRFARGAPRLGEHNGMVVGADPGMRSRRAQTTAPAGGQAGTASLALDGVRVLDLTANWAGPMCTLLLADMGADVIKVESEARPDLTRRFGPFAEGEPGLERSGYFAGLCRGKRSLALNLGTPQGLAFLKGLVPLVDVVVDNFSPRVMPKLGLSYENLRSLKGDIIMCSMSGYGATGPQRDYVAYGQPLEAFTGYDRLIGYADSPPMALGVPLADQLTGLYGALAVVGALRHRARTGQGQFIDLSECEALASVMVLPFMELSLTGNVRRPQGNRDDVMVPHNCYRCAGEDAWVTIAVGTEKEWRALCAAAGHLEWATDPWFSSPLQRRRNQDALDALLAEWTARRSSAEITALLQGAGVAASPTASGDSLIQDPHLAARGFFATVPHPVVGPRLAVGPFARTEPALAAVRSGAPLLGEHTKETLGELLGLPARELQRVQQEGIAR